MNDPDPTVTAPTWTADAQERLARAPAFLRGMVRRLAEKKAHELGKREITGALLDQFKQQMMGGMGGQAGLADAADRIKRGELPWTTEARKRLDDVPEFMRPMIRNITEEVARERGHLEVNVDVFETVETMGDRTDGAAAPLAWTDGAMAMLRDKVRRSPPIALEFVTDMLKCDAEDLARESGATTIDEQTLTQVWDAPRRRVAWSDDAWKRLLTSPDFVRSGIRKAAERRARKLGLREIDSAHLTTFRNEAMMKAVKRIRSFGYQELTFDAFEDALAKVKRLKGNEQAEHRLTEIRDYMKDKPDVGVLGEELMGRFRRYLKGEGTL